MAINVAAELMQAGDEMRAALARVGDVYRELSPLPAPALTEQAIVDALKADPAMAGRVIGKVAQEYSLSDRCALSLAARDYAAPSGIGTTRCAPLRSLSVALAAASYRG